MEGKDTFQRKNHPRRGHSAVGEEVLSGVGEKAGQLGLRAMRIGRGPRELLVRVRRD